MSYVGSSLDVLGGNELYLSAHPASRDSLEVQRRAAVVTVLCRGMSAADRAEVLDMLGLSATYAAMLEHVREARAAAQEPAEATNTAGVVSRGELHARDSAAESRNGGVA